MPAGAAFRTDRAFRPGAAVVAFAPFCPLAPPNTLRASFRKVAINGILVLKIVGDHCVDIDISEG